MDIKPLGKRILVKVEKIENKTKSGLILIEDTNYFENFAKIIEVGDDITNLNIGDYVIFDKEKSLEVRKNNDIEYIVNLEDVYAKVGK